MPIRAANDPRFFRRFLYLGIAALGFALYCLYDGLLAYPYQRERAFADFKSNKLFTDNPQLSGLSVREFELAADKELRKVWDDYLHELGKPSYGDVVMQFVMAGLSVALGAWMISLPLRARGRWIEATETGLHSSWGQSLTYDQITGINKRQWRSKGIAKITYHDGRRKRRFVIDDYKFERHATDAILYEVEQRIDPALIHGGPPEPQPGQHGESEAEAPAASHDLASS